MEIRLDQVTLEETDSRLTATPEELQPDLELAKLCSDVEYRLVHHRVDKEIFLSGRVSFILEFTCARCLENYRRNFLVPLNLVLQLVAEEQMEDADETDDEFIPYPESKPVYNLDRHLRDLITLEVPMKPLCRDDCAGLCSQCGANLNNSSCNCRTERTDPRWEGLRRLGNEN
ncbi:MAG: DUF177 domain-containing protein [candidate division Zixibacteria bacterium]|nr:DUF177 domain-containing protein [candidate division Zixibacteria bacterium]